MRFLRHLTEKPWETDPSWVDGVAPTSSSALRLSSSVALNFFLAIVAILFFLLIVTYAGRMAFEDWRPAPPLGLLWQNTIILILASAAMEWARQSAVRNRIDSVKLAMLAAGILTAAFVTGQALAWSSLHSMPVFDATNPAIAFFYLITGLHALHMLGGLVAWGRVLDKIWSGAELDAVRRSVQLCARYWHFLLIVWLVLFGLLFSGNDNLNFLLSICGLR
jgi:cytochrome c oxidase subunit 3